MLAIKEETIMVSICCITYNQEDYIAQAIESFLMQKTDFIYEILIHDDASTDNTNNIIHSYEKKYPDIIKPIYQIENQYSQGKKVFIINSQRAKGKYIAVCEGDDYWTDPYKLQKQVDYMEKHLDCSLCIHATKTVDANNQPMSGVIRPTNSNKDFSVVEVITRDNGLYATNSMMYPTKFLKTTPRFYYNTAVGDYPRVIHLALEGNVHYIDEFMSVYRVQAKGSWTSMLTKTKSIDNLLNFISMLHEVNEYSSFKYSITINKKISEFQNAIYKLEFNFKMRKDIKYKEYFSKFSTFKKIISFLDCYFPNIVVILKKINDFRKETILVYRRL